MVLYLSYLIRVLCVAFHHRNGPMVEYVYPSFPSHKRTLSETIESVNIELPEEWNFMPFMCLPDGAHASEEEIIYFHLPPVSKWAPAYQQTTFGVACYRQIDATVYLTLH